VSLPAWSSAHIRCAKLHVSQPACHPAIDWTCPLTCPARTPPLPGLQVLIDKDTAYLETASGQKVKVSKADIKGGNGGEY